MKILKSFSSAIAVLVIALACQPSLAQDEQIKPLETADLLPCTKELCLGDSLDKLSQVKFDVARANDTSSYDGSYEPGVFLKEMLLTPKTPNLKTWPPLGPIYRGSAKSIADASLYLQNMRFDNKSLALLEKIPAACVAVDLQGRYLSGAHREIVNVVHIALVPHVDSSAKQSWIVTSIERYLPRAILTAEQSNQWNRTLGQYYPNTYRGHENAKANGVVSADTFQRFNPKLYFQLTGVMDRTFNSNALRSHPLCQSAAPGV